MADVLDPGLLRDYLGALRRGEVEFSAADILVRSPVAVRDGEQMAFVAYETTLREATTLRHVHDVDTGDLVITTQRYVFLGEKRTVSAEYSDILSVEPQGCAIAVHRASREQPEPFGNLGANEVGYTTDGRRTLLTGLILTCLFEGLLAKYRPPAGQPGTSGTPSIADELAKLADLRDRGVLSEEEFAELKAELLKRPRT